MSAPFISVVVTTYNYAKFIEGAIDSVLSQEYPQDRIEVVVADDGSTDDTEERVKKYDSRVKYLHQVNKGQAAALNLGFTHASGEIISLLDGDDFFLPGKLSLVADAFERDPKLGMVYHPMEAWDIRTGERRNTPYELLSGSLPQDLKKFLWYLGPGTCVSFRRRFLEKLLPIPEGIRMLADCYPATLILFLAPILALPECLSVYRVHGNNSFQAKELSRDVRKARLSQWEPVIGLMQKWLKDNGYTRRADRYMADSWDYHLYAQRFALKPPGRLRYFWFILWENRLASPLQTWKLTAFNYLFAPVALLMGYNGASRFHNWRGRLMRTFQASPVEDQGGRQRRREIWDDSAENERSDKRYN